MSENFKKNFIFIFRIVQMLQQLVLAVLVPYYLGDLN